jgi:ribosomal protein L27
MDGMLSHAAIETKGAPAAALSCRAPLPKGPRVPAPIVLRTACGSFRLGRDGTVTRQRASPQTGRSRVADLTVRRNRAGRFIVLRRGHIVWRSSGSYPHDGTQIAFGRHSFAFATYRGGVYLTDLEGPERMVVRGRSMFPLGIASDGDLMVAGKSHIRVISSAGELLRTYGYRTRNAYAFDERTQELVFVTPNGRLASGAPRTVLSRRRIPLRDGWISLAQGPLLVLEGRRELVLARRDGRVVARARWPATGASDSGVMVSPDGRSASFRLTTAHPGDRSGTASVYVLHAGDSAARLVYRDRLGPMGCAPGSSMSWRGDDLLYSRSGGEIAVIDTRTGAVVETGQVARLLAPGNLAGIRAAWQT